jgi:all-trans-nonaprenyl-diphosphate synthase
MSLLSPNVQDIFELLADPLQAVKCSLLAVAPPHSQDLADTVRQSLSSGGKYLRPTITLLMGSATCNDRREPHSHALIEAAAVTEMIHVATLLHDDVIDQSDLRRGQKTARAVWGNKMAVLGGDYLLAQASVKLAKLGNTRLVSIFAWVLSDLCNGEVEQMQASYPPPNALWESESQWESYFRKTFCKTASLFSAGCESAGVLNSLTEAEIQGLKAYGRHLGIAFQIMDDLLDYTATEEELGKPVLGDVRNGLINAPILLALESDHLTPASRLALRKAMQTLFKGPDVKAAEEIQTLLLDCNALEETRQLARRQIQSALDSINFIPDSPERSALQALAHYVLERRQ